MSRYATWQDVGSAIEPLVAFAVLSFSSLTPVYVGSNGYWSLRIVSCCDAGFEYEAYSQRLRKEFKDSASKLLVMLDLYPVTIARHYL